MYHCLPPFPLKHICSLTNAHAARQARRDPQHPNRERDVCCLTVCQQAQINSTASSPQRLSSLLLTSETFPHCRPCDLTFPESFTQPAMHRCVLWMHSHTFQYAVYLSSNELLSIFQLILLVLWPKSVLINPLYAKCSTWSGRQILTSWWM